MLGKIHTPLRILLLDGHRPQALAMVRSLGRRHARVTVASPRPYAPALQSRYCADFLRSPEPHLGPGDFRRWLFAALRHERYDALLCCTAETVEILAPHAPTIRLYSRCALPQAHVLHDLSRPRARRSLLLQRELGWLQPDVPPLPPTRSRDYALLALVRRGEPVATFVHRLHHGPGQDSLPWEARMAEESVEHDAVRKAGLRVLQVTGWEGPVTLGFRHDLERDTLALLDVRPAWGDGLELAIACGIDLPWLYAQVAAGHPITGPTRTRLGMKFLRLFTPGSTRSPIQRLVGLATVCLPKRRSDFQLRDPLPHLPLLGRLVLWLRRQTGPRRRPRPLTPPQLEVLPGGNRPASSQASSSIPTRAGGASP